MPKEAVFTMKLESELRDEFMAEAQALDRPASQVVRDLMREFVHRRREARAYDTFVRHKVETARKEMHAGRGRSNVEVGADFIARRAELLSKAAVTCPGSCGSPRVSRDVSSRAPAAVRPGRATRRR